MVNAVIVIIVLSTFLLTFIQSNDLNTTESCTVLYEKGVEAYLENRFEDCVDNFEKALGKYRAYRKTLQNCRLSCKNSADLSEPLYPINVDDLLFFEKAVRQTLCIIECENDSPEILQNYNVNKEVEKLFEEQKPYEYLHLCYYQTKQLMKAASSAFTYLVANPDDKIMRSNLKQYFAMKEVNKREVVNFEAKDYVYLYVHGSDAYDRKVWQDVVDYMENSLREYLQAEAECRAHCEGPFDHGWYPDFIPSISRVQGEAESEGPSESECRPYIEKALKELETGDLAGESSETGESQEDIPTVEVTDDSDHQDGEGDNDSNEGQENTKSVEEEVTKQLPEPEVRLSFFQRIPILSKFFQTAKKQEVTTEEKISESKLEEQQDQPAGDDNRSDETDKDSKEDDTESAEKQARDEDSKEKGSEEAEQVSSTEENDVTTEDKTDTVEDGDSDQDEKEESEEDTIEVVETLEPNEQVESVEQQQGQSSAEDQAESQEDQNESKENQVESKEQEDDQDEIKEDLVESREGQPESSEEAESKYEKENTQQSTEATEEQADSVETTEDQIKEEDSTEEETKNEEKSIEDESGQSKDETLEGIKKEEDSKETEGIKDDLSDKTLESNEDDKKDSVEETSDTAEEKEGSKETSADDTVEEQSKRDIGVSDEENTDEKDDDNDEEQKYSKEDGPDRDSEEDDKTKDKAEVEELSLDVEMPSELRSRDHVEQLLKLDDRSSDTENIINKVSEITLKELKKLYENAIKPLEVLYKYRDLSNRHFGDAEIFSKPLILFMGPWSGGKSSIINYLVNNEFNETSLRTGAEPSPAYFNILMHGDEPEVIDGTELAADFTFSGLQKFGQGLEERLRGVKIPTKLLEKVNIVEIPGILEVRKQVSRVFPFNDACQWFIDRADIIFLVYDPSKLDVGPETEAILDQLKGREHQTRIVLNKADQVKPEELMRVQGALIWNISPLMSSPQPPIMYTASLWSRPYESWAPVRLLQAQERAFLRDLRSAIDKRIENKIASARRFAVRVRNHAKMVDCYLTTYYNHKSVFGNRKQVANEIIEHPQDYHIYEGLSTLTNISRYDLPDPDVYRDFFKLNPLYEFQQLSATCTYFRGCPINRLDVAIAYDLPELVGTYKKLVENALADNVSPSTSAPGS